VASKKPKLGAPADVKLAMVKLQSSGLTMEDAIALGMQFLSPDQTSKLHKSFDAKTSIKINYFGLDGKPMRPRPKWPEFYRLRYLESGDREGRVTFSQQTDEKPKRYVNEPEAGVAAYFPRTVDWEDIAQDTAQPLIITEGEFKAAKATVEGFPTIGLGGVFNYRAVRQGIPFLPELEQINWVKRYVYICYDSDFRTNQNICHALNALAEELQERGAIPMVLALPDVVDDGKTGLDDLLVSAPQAIQLLTQLLKEAEPLGLARALWQMNDRVVYVQDPGLVVRRSNHQKMSPAQFKEHAFSTVNYVEQTMGADGEMRYKKVPAAPAWIKWPLRNECTKVVYKPGQPELVSDIHGGDAFNIWKGWGCKPEKGDVSMWHELLDHLFDGADKEDRIWFERWLAYPLQFPGTKLFSACVMHGIHHGTGKSLIGFMMGRIYGDNFVEINRKMLELGNNDWAEAKQFVLADEVTGSSKREFNDMLKKMITQERMRINIKYVPTFDLEDFINYYFTSNHPDAFFMEDNERRYFIHEVRAKPLDLSFYSKFDEWMKRGNGPSAVFHYLLNLKLGDFNPYAAARKTEALERMILDTKSDLGSWVLRLKEDPEAMIRAWMPANKDLVTNADLLQIYDPNGRTGTTANGLGRELRRAGIPLAYGGRPLPGPNGADRYYILRNREKWFNANRAILVKHIETFSKKRRTVKSDTKF